MSGKLPEEGLNRRGFLRAGLGSATVAAGSVALPVATAQAAENDAEKKKARYKETDHVKAYYRTNRY
jgi:hypothetical protein